MKVSNNKDEQQELWKKFRLGDRVAFSQLYHQHVALVYQYARCLTQEEAQIEQCIHDLFLHLWQRRASLPVPASVKFFLFSALKKEVEKINLAQQGLHIHSRHKPENNGKSLILSA